MDIAIIFGLILLNGIFAMSEMAIVSAKRLRLQQAAETGSESAKKALQLSQDPSRFLSTVQVGITLIGILAGAFGEDSIAGRLETRFLEISWLADYAGPLSWGVMVIIITYFSLIFGELVPKRLALMNPELIAKLVARPMDTISKFSAPLVWLLSVSTDALLRLLGARSVKQESIIEEEIHSLIRQGAESGEFEETEQQMIRNVLRLDQRRVGNIMTLRKDMFYLDLSHPFEQNRDKIANTAYTRLLVCREGLNNIVGVLETTAILQRLMHEQSLDIEALVQPALIVPRTLSTLQLLDRFKKSKTDLAIVVDEQNQTSGIVSVSDVMASIVGDFPLGDDDEEPDFVERDDHTWLVSGQVDTASFKDKFGIRALPEEEEYHTVGGLIMTALGRLPKIADVVQLDEVRLEVMDMDGNRVDRVLVTRRTAAETDSLEQQSLYSD